MLMLSAATCYPQTNPPTLWSDVVGYWFGVRLVSNRGKTKCVCSKIKIQAQSSPLTINRGEGDELGMERKAENETWRIRLADPAAGEDV